MDNPDIKDNEILCRCGNNKPSQEYHSCPFAEEIGDNHDEEYCDCCDECTHQCAMDI